MGFVLEFCPENLDVPDYARRHAVQGDFLFDCVPPPPKEGNVYALVKLEPGRFYGIADEIKVTDVVSKPGEYDISVTYNRSISRSIVKEFLQHDPISTLSVDDGAASYEGS